MYQPISIIIENTLKEKSIFNGILIWLTITYKIGIKSNISNKIQSIYKNNIIKFQWIPYIPCYTPRRLKGGERSVARSVAKWVQKIFFVLTHCDRLSSILINLIFSVFLFPRGVRGELEKEKLLIRYRNNCQFLL